MARLTRQESREGTREHLLEAGQLAVARNGHNGTSIADIAGFSKGAFFSSYEGKEPLLLELLRRHKEQDIATLSRILGGAEQGRDAASALDRHLEGLRVMPIRPGSTSSCNGTLRATRPSPPAMTCCRAGPGAASPT